MMYDDFRHAVKRKIVCFGAGRSASAFLRSRAATAFAEQIAYFVDNDAGKQGSTITCMGRSFFVFPPEKMREDSDAIVLITIADSDAVAAIKQQIHEITGSSVKCFSWQELFLGRELAAQFDRKSDNATRFILLNTPSYDNLGDHAIAMAERAFLKTGYRNDVIELCDDNCRHCMRDISGRITNNDILMITGGGNMGSLYGGYNNVFQRVLEHFPDNNIIIFPQSVHYGADEMGMKILERAKYLFNAHRRLMVCARDGESYRKLARYFPSCGRLLIPDMVLSMGWPMVNVRSGIGICLRSDKERNLPQDVTGKILEAARSMGTDVSAMSQHREGVITQNTEMAVLEKLCEYSSFRCVITDRLHGIVFSVITGTPCIAMDNSYGKNRALYETWLKDMAHIRFIGSPVAADWGALIAEKLESGAFGYDLAGLRPMYSPLQDYIASLEGVVTNA